MNRSLFIEKQGGFMKKIFLILMLAFSVFLLNGCNKKNTVIIYTSNEDFRNNMVMEILRKEIPDVNIILQYYSTGNHAAKLKAEGIDTQADIFLDLEVGYAENLLEMFADLSGYDISKYTSDILPNHNKYHIWAKEAGCIIINNKVLKENNLPKPTKYEDLLNPIYTNLVMMPNPKSSGTGYCFYNSLVSSWGEEKALSYFADLSKIVKQFSESGSGPVKSLDKGEIAIGLGMTFQAVSYVNSNPDLEIIFFDEGSPYTLYSMGIINGKELKPNVKRVYDVLYDIVVEQDKVQFVPEKIFNKQKETIIKGYPLNVKYSKMNGLFDSKYKESLLDKWKW